jgi:hypothetical protein
VRTTSRHVSTTEAWQWHISPGFDTGISILRYVGTLVWISETLIGKTNDMLNICVAWMVSNPTEVLEVDHEYIETGCRVRRGKLVDDIT